MYCHTHHSLVKAHDMCDGCLCSFLDKLENKIKEDSECRRRCSCCSIPYRNRTLALKMLRNKRTVEFDIDLVLPKVKDKHGKPPLSKNSVDGLSHIGYNEVKITSDTESEIPFSEDDDKKSLSKGVNDVKEELLSRCIQGSLSKNLSEFDTDEKLFMNSQVKNTQSTTGIGHGLEEISWTQVEVKPNSSETSINLVPVEDLITKLDAPDNSSYASNGDATKSISSNDTGLKSNNIMNDRPKIPLPLPPTSESNSKLPEDLKTRLSQMQNGKLNESTWNESDDQSKMSDTSSSNGFPILPSQIDGSLAEIEGESAIDRLKRQIEMDRKSMIVLYKELEEERNASAIAANQAMAMINRLQEEKASMQMEASQYLRMMEEQTEYDQEALQKLNDLLAEKDDEIQDLEATVDLYRMQYGDEPLSCRGTESFDSQEREFTPVSTPRFIRSRGRDIGKTLVKNTVLDFEDEKFHISDCLQRLERKLRQFARSEKEGDDAVANKNDDITKEEMPSTPSFESIPFSIKQAFKESRLRSVSSYNDRQFQTGGKNSNDVNALGHEILQLHSRLEALEEDRNFLEHAVSSLRNGSSGIQFIQEIASHLRELRNLWSTQQE